MQLSLNQKTQYEDILNDLKKDGITGEWAEEYAYDYVINSYYASFNFVD